MPWHETARYRMVWHDMVWPGMDDMVRYGTTCLGMARHDTTRHGIVWFGMAAWHGMAWHGMAWHGTARHGTVRHGTARHGTAWHGTARHDMARHGLVCPGMLFIFIYLFKAKTIRENLSQYCLNGGRNITAKLT